MRETTAGELCKILKEHEGWNLSNHSIKRSIIILSISTLYKISYHTEICTIRWWICFS